MICQLLPDKKTFNPTVFCRMRLTKVYAGFGKIAKKDRV